MSSLSIAATALLGMSLSSSSSLQVHASNFAQPKSQPATLQVASASHHNALHGTTPSTGSSGSNSPLVIGPCDVIDDGSSENALGFSLPTGTDVLWMQRQGDIGQSTVVTAISTVWGTPAFPGSGPADGSVVRYGVWQDNDNDGNPTAGLTLVAGPFSAFVTGSEMDLFQSLPVDPPAVISGVYFIGVSAEGAFPAPLDQSVAANGRTWIVGNNTGAQTIDYTNLNGEPIPPLNAFAPGVWLLRADCISKGTVEEVCAGDGSIGNCPCNNNAPASPVQGCLWMTNNPPVLSAQGGHLEQVSGTIASISASITTQLKLTCTGHRPSTQAVSVLMQGNDPTNQYAYGNGIRCILGPFKRLYIFTPTPAAVTAPDTSTTPGDTFSARAAVLGDIYSPGVIRGYQLLYRDPLGLCGTYNASNGILAVWAP